MDTNGHQWTPMYTNYRQRFDAFAISVNLIRSPSCSLTPAGHVVLSHSCPKRLQTFGVLVYIRG